MEDDIDGTTDAAATITLITLPVSERLPTVPAIFLLPRVKCYWSFFGIFRSRTICNQIASSIGASGDEDLVFIAHLHTEC